MIRAAAPALLFVAMLAAAGCQERPLHLFDDADADERTTAEEMRDRYAEAFVRFDTDSDGVLNALELDAATAGRRRMTSARVLALMDVDGDGAVTRAEADLAASRRFDDLDADNDGVVEPEERARERARRRSPE